jgi:hypothetical protein
MPYIDTTYYLGTYLGADPSDSVMLQKAINRASEVIDILTHYALADTQDEENMKNGGLSSQRTFVQDQIKKAVAAQAEHYILNGGYDAFKQQVDQAYIGDFKFTNNVSTPEVPETVFALLSTTGLLHTEIHSGFDNGLYYIGWWY